MRELNEVEMSKLIDSNLKYIGIIPSSKKVLVYECIQHGVIEQRFDVHVKHNNKCVKCPRVKIKYTKNYIDELVKKRDVKYDVIYEKDVYGVNDFIKLICKEHNIFEQRIHNHFNIGNNCPKCSSKKDVILNSDIIEVMSRWNIDIVEYNGYRENSIFNCKLHGKFNSKIETIKKNGCSLCNNEKRNEKNRNIFIEKSKKKWNGIVDFDYDNILFIDKKVKIHSDITGWIEQNRSNHIRGFLPKNSTGESIIKNIFDNRNIRYDEQKTFDDCKNKNKLRFDFYLPEKSICIEFNGKQHYEPIDFFGGVDRFEKQQINDRIKVDFCKNNNIRLMVISYKDSILEKIKEILC